MRLVGQPPAFHRRHAEKARRRLFAPEQRQPTRLRLLQRLFTRQRQRRCSIPLRRHLLALRRARDAQCRLLGGGEAALRSR